MKIDFTTHATGAEEAMHAWFMFDNHTFAPIDLATQDRQAITDRVLSLFDRDKYGCIFVRDAFGHTITKLTLQDRASADAIDRWVDHALQEVSFVNRMNA